MLLPFNITEDKFNIAYQCSLNNGQNPIFKYNCCIKEVAPILTAIQYSMTDEYLKFADLSDSILSKHMFENGYTRNVEIQNALINIANQKINYTFKNKRFNNDEEKDDSIRKIKHLLVDIKELNKINHINSFLKENIEELTNITLQKVKLYFSETKDKRQVCIGYGIDFDYIFKDDNIKSVNAMRP